LSSTGKPKIKLTFRPCKKGRQREGRRWRDAPMKKFHQLVECGGRRFDEEERSLGEEMRNHERERGEYKKFHYKVLQNPFPLDNCL
jgi:hypothetical protein